MWWWRVKRIIHSNVMLTVWWIQCVGQFNSLCSWWLPRIIQCIFTKTLELSISILFLNSKKKLFTRNDNYIIPLPFHFYQHFILNPVQHEVVAYYDRTQKTKQLPITKQMKRSASNRLSPHGNLSLVNDCAFRSNILLEAGIFFVNPTKVSCKQQKW